MFAIPLLDTHVHLMEPDRLRYPWLAATPVLNRRHGLAEYAAARGKVAIEGFIVVEADAADGAQELDYLLEQARHEPLLKAIVAHLPLEQGASLKQRLQVLSGNPLVRGLRRLLQDEPQPGFCLQPDFVAGCRAAGEAGLIVDLCIRHHQLPDLVALTGAVPDTRFVLDHIGKPNIRDGLDQVWRRDLALLAARRNVWCKISGVATEADHAHWTAEQLHPYIEHALETFGPERVMFGSDWPVATLAIDWVTWVEILDEVMLERPEADRLAFWAGNARTCYGLAS